MLPYSLHYFKELIETGRISEIRPSDVWYEERTDFSPKAFGNTSCQPCKYRFWTCYRNASSRGKILGGCLESLYDIFDNSRYVDSTELCQKYRLFPDLSDWKGKILLLETSEEKPEPDDFKKMLQALKETGIFEVISGLLVGKPMDETFYDDYKEALLDIIDSNIPIVYNLNVGHATPRAIVPFGVHAHVDAKKQVIRFDYNKESWDEFLSFFQYRY